MHETLYVTLQASEAEFFEFPFYIFTVLSCPEERFAEERPGLKFI